MGGVKAPEPLDWHDLPDSARRVYLELLRYGPLTRPELAARASLSPSSLSRVSAPLRERGLLVEGELRRAPLGRPTTPLDVAIDRYSLIGISITHESIVAIATDARLGVLSSRTLSITDTSPTAVLDAAAHLVDNLRIELASARPGAQIAAIGVSIGGQIDRARVVREAPFLGWRDVDAGGILAGRTGLPVLIGHDLTVLAEAENWFGIGLETDRFIVLTVGIGTGFALVLNNQVITDANTGFGTLTDAIRGPNWPSFAHPEKLDYEDLSRAARALGRLVGTAAAFTMPRGVVISGEAAHLLAGHEEELDAGIAEVRHHNASGLDIRLRQHDFAFWARGAATAAIQWILETDKAPAPHL